MKALHKGVTRKRESGLAEEPEMPALPTYLAKVGSVYKFRARIPQDLLPYYHPKKEITESLGTKSLTDAKRLLPAIVLKYQEEWADIRAAVSPDMTDLDLTDANIDYLTRLFEHESLSGDERTRLAGNYTLEEIQDYRERLNESTALLRDMAATGDIEAIRPALDQYLHLKRLRFSGSEEDYRKLALAYIRVAVRTNTALLARMNGEAVATPQLEAHPTTRPAAKTTQGGPSLYSLFEYWRDAVPGRPQRTIDDFERCVRAVDAVTGSKPASELTKADVVAYRDALLAKGKRPSTVEKDLSFLKTILRYAYESDKLASNPSEGVKVAKAKVGKTSMRTLSQDDLARLFGSTIYTAQDRPTGGGHEAAAWLPLLGLYTGARLEELAQLRVADVQTHLGIHSLQIIDLDDDQEDVHTRVKTEESRRVVPIHADVVRAGFLDYVAHVKGQGHDWLFPHLAVDRYGKRSGNWSKWWSRWRTKLGVDGRHQVFHAFRHNFKTACREAEVSEETHDALTGHASGSVGRGYGTVTLKAKATAMARVKPLGAIGFDWVWQPSGMAWDTKPVRQRRQTKPSARKPVAKTKTKG